MQLQDLGRMSNMKKDTSSRFNMRENKYEEVADYQGKLLGC